MNNANKKRFVVLMIVVTGICLVTGCGDDTDVTIPSIPVRRLEDTAEEAWNDLSEGSLVLPDKADERGDGIGGQGDGIGGQGDGIGGQGNNIRGQGNSTAGQEDIIHITISAAGDCSLGNHHQQEYYSSFRQAYDQAEDDSYFFENVYEIFAADDMTIVNLEGVFTFSEERKEDRTYNIKGDPDYAKILTSGSVEAVSMGNNHRMDYGEGGSRDTVNALEQEGIVYAYDANVGIYEVKGIRIGIVSVNESYLGAAVEKTMENGINELKEEGVDLILACCHWGTERDYYPEEYQSVLGRKCIDWGADLVIGHHPHVLQGVDVYQGKYIIYSLGNFCFGANRNPEDKDTMIFQQTFAFRKGEKLDLDEARIIPCSVSSVTTRNDFKPTPAVMEEGKRIIQRVNEFSADFGVSIDEEGRILHQ